MDRRHRPPLRRGRARGLYIAYVTPTLLRRLQAKSWEGGRWSLGKWSPFIGWLGVTWVVIIAILFMLPEFSPINRDSFNYAPIAVGVVLLYADIYWLVSARNWFTGPKPQGTEAELANIERVWIFGSVEERRSCNSPRGRGRAP